MGTASEALSRFYKEEYQREAKREVAAQLERLKAELEAKSVQMVAEMKARMEAEMKTRMEAEMKARMEAEMKTEMEAEMKAEKARMEAQYAAYIRQAEESKQEVQRLKKLLEKQNITY